MGLKCKQYITYNIIAFFVKIHIVVIQSYADTTLYNCYFARIDFWNSNTCLVCTQNFVAKAKLKSKLNPAQDIHCNFVKCKVCKQCSLPILQRVAPNAKKVLSLFLVAIHKDEIDRKREGKSFKKTLEFQFSTWK